jgi:hypothetical protein
MAAGSTYEPIATTTLGTAVASYTFNSLGSYTDLIIVGSAGFSTAGDEYSFRFNGDTASNYSFTAIIAPTSGASASNAGGANQTYGNINRATAASVSSVPNTNFYLRIFSYANTNFYKTTLSRVGTVVGTYNGMESAVNTWRSTSAITSITILTTGGGGNFNADSTFTLYGIKAA